MTRGMRTSIVAVAAIGLALGAVFGVKKGIWLSQSFDQAEPIFLSDATADFAAEQFEYADTAHAREAVALQIHVLELLGRLGNEPGDDDWTGWAYVRLAMIEESSGQKQAERIALERAREYFRRSHPAKELTDDEMKSALVRMDEAMGSARL